MKSFETSIASYSVITDESEIDVSSIPPQFRRRLSPLQKIYFSLAAKLQAETYDYAVFSSEFGEDSLTRRLVADFNDGIGISPQRFSTSRQGAMRSRRRSAGTVYRRVDNIRQFRRRGRTEHRGLRRRCWQSPYGGICAQRLSRGRGEICFRTFHLFKIL